MILNPHMLPKVRSEALKEKTRDHECFLKLGTFIGKSCTGPTSENVHLDGIAPALGKGQGTKVSDLNSVGGCRGCHDLLARVDPAWEVLMERYPAAVLRQIHMAHMAQLAIWIDAGVITVLDGEIV